MYIYAYIIFITRDKSPELTKEPLSLIALSYKQHPRKLAITFTSSLPHLNSAVNIAATSSYLHSSSRFIQSTT